MRDRTVLVTGAASGIGAAVCRALFTAGARPVLLDVDEARGGVLASELDAPFIRCDVSDRSAWFRAVAQCVDTIGVPDDVHLNAGIMSVPADAPFVPLEALPEENYRRIVDVNLGGVVYGLQALVPHMRERQGTICVTASLAGLVALPVDPMYSATKHALVGLVRSLAAAWAESPLRINAICPGGVDTAIVPAALRDSGLPVMAVEVLAREVIDLLSAGDNGEIRLRAAEDAPAVSVPAPQVG